MSKPTSDSSTNSPARARSTVSTIEQSALRYINKGRNKLSGPLNRRPNFSAPSSFAFASHPCGNSAKSLGQSSFSFCGASTVTADYFLGESVSIIFYDVWLAHMGVHPSTVGREIHRNGAQVTYKAVLADKRSDVRQRGARKFCKPTVWLHAHLPLWLEQGFSPSKLLAD